VTLLTELWVVAAKDLRIEARSRVTVAQVLPFGLIVLILFAFALDPDRGLLPKVAPGLFWVAVLLAALLAVSRAFAIEQANMARDGLRLSGLDSGAIFLGKALAVALQLLALEVVLGLGVVLFYDLTPRAAEVLIPAALAATVGLAAAGTLYGVLAAGLRVRETLLPLLILPVLAPVMLGATRAFEAGLGLNGSTGEAWPWVELLALFAVIYTTMGFLAFGPLLEEA
jgi:heme exporter protein B